MYSQLLINSFLWNPVWGAQNEILLQIIQSAINIYLCDIFTSVYHQFTSKYEPIKCNPSLLNERN